MPVMLSVSSAVPPAGCAPSVPAAGCAAAGCRVHFRARSCSVYMSLSSSRDIPRSTSSSSHGVSPATARATDAMEARSTWSQNT